MTPTPGRSPRPGSACRPAPACRRPGGWSSRCRAGSTARAAASAPADLFTRADAALYAAKAAGRGTLRVVLSWAVVLALLTYGVVMTLSTALKLFTG